MTYENRPEWHYPRRRARDRVHAERHRQSSPTGDPELITMSDDRWIPADTWATTVERVPLVAVDLVVRHDGGVLLG